MVAIAVKHFTLSIIEELYYVTAYEAQFFVDNTIELQVNRLEALIGI